MYPVSQAFMDAIGSNSREFYWSGVLTAKDGKEYPFSNADIVKGSCSITNQCCGNNEIELGSVYAAQLDIALYLDIDRYTLEGGFIVLSFFLKIAKDTFEEVPMGIFDISEANRGIKSVSIKAYDHMLRFEDKFDETLTNGYAYDLLSYACEVCEVPLAHTQEEMATWLNATEVLGIYPDNDIETWRDLIFYVAQALGRFCTINRAGALELRTYGTEPVLNISDRQRYDSSFSDFVTRYTAINSTNKRTATSEYYSLDQDDGLTMNLGVHPLLQFGLDDTRRELLTNILNMIAVMEYVPFDSSTIGNPALDLGDIITFSGQHAGEQTLTCMTKYVCRVNGKYDIACVGKDPRLAAAKSKNDKNISGLINDIEAEKIAVYKFINSSAYRIGREETRVVYMEFASNSNTDAQFNANILLDIVADEVVKTGSVTIDEETYDVSVPDDGMAILKVVYVYNDVRIVTFTPMETLHSGKHILSLYYPLTGITSSTLNTFQVYLSITNDTATIAVGQAICTINGQGLSASSEWNGHFDVSDNIPLIRMTFNNMAPAIEDEINAEVQRPTAGHMTETISGISMSIGTRIVSFTEEVTPFPVCVKNTIDARDAGTMTFNRYYVNIDDGFRLETEYSFVSHEQTFERGRLVKVTADTEQFVRVDGIEVK